MRFPGNLPAQQQITVEIGVATVLLIAAVALNHLLQRFADQHRRIIQRTHLHQIRLLLSRNPRTQQAYDALGGGQIAGGL